MTPEEKEMRDTLLELTKRFEEYKAQFNVLEKTCEGFESECERLTAVNEAFKTILAKSKEMIEQENLAGLKMLYMTLRL
ncbi:MAG: hypothetical protein GY861_17985 [bacterium]|nr:hypothetical protein [bacterium]